MAQPIAFSYKRKGKRLKKPYPIFPKRGRVIKGRQRKMPRPRLLLKYKKGLTNCDLCRDRVTRYWKVLKGYYKGKIVCGNCASERGLTEEHMRIVARRNPYVIKKRLSGDKVISHPLPSIMKVDITPNEYRFRVKDPLKFTKFRKTDFSGKLPDGVKVVRGRVGTYYWETQSVHFKKDKFTLVEAKKWLKEHKSLWD